MIIGFFQIGFGWIVVLVVFVAGIAGPIAIRGPNLCHQQAIGPILVFHHDRVDISRVGPLPPFFHWLGTRRDRTRRMPPLARRTTNREFKIGLRGDFPDGLVGYIECMRRLAAENIGPQTQGPEIIPIDDGGHLAS